MSDAILLSVKPQWLNLILGGEKTVELRKSRPAIQPPFRVLLYCSQKGTTNPNRILEIHDGAGKIHKANGFVVGECVCDRIDTIVHVGFTGFPGPLRYRIRQAENPYPTAEKLFEEACLDEAKVEGYLRGRIGFCWHIRDVQTYSVPKTLEECGFDRPPQSWRYIADA